MIFKSYKSLKVFGFLLFLRQIWSMWSENVGTSSHPVAKLLTPLLLLITSSRSLSWFGCCCKLSADIDKGMKEKERPQAVLEFVDGWVSAGITAQCLCWVIGRFDLLTLYLSPWWLVLPLIALIHSLCCLNVDRKSWSTVIKHNSVRPFLPSSSWRFFSLLLNLFNLKSFEEQSSDWSVVFAWMCKKRCALKPNNLTLLQIIPKAASSKSRLHLNRHKVV